MTGVDRDRGCTTPGIPSACTVMLSLWPSETIGSSRVSLWMLAFDGLTKDWSILMIIGRKSAR